jgi:hypothetical protein
MTIITNHFEVFLVTSKKQRNGIIESKVGLYSIKASSHIYVSCGQDSVSGIVRKEAFTRGVVGAIFAIYTRKNILDLCDPKYRSFSMLHRMLPKIISGKNRILHIFRSIQHAYVNLTNYLRILHWRRICI